MILVPLVLGSKLLTEEKRRDAEEFWETVGRQLTSISWVPPLGRAEGWAY